MLKYILSLTTAVLLSGAAMAQTTTTQSSSYSNNEYKKNEFYVGYSQQRGSSDEAKLNGFETSAVHNVSRYVGLKANFTAGFANPKNLSYYSSTPTPGLYTAEAKIQNYAVGGGVQFKDNSLSGSRLKPFAHGLVGASFNRVKYSYLGRTDKYNDTALTFTVGGGLDVRVKDNFQIRLIQVDYNPIIVHGGASRYRLGAGVVF